MSAIGNIAIQDGQATPVTHTFYPVKSGPQTLLRENLTTLALIGQGIVAINTDNLGKGGLNRVKLVMELPALETATAQNSAGYTAAPKVAYTHKVVVDFFLPSRGTSAQRKDLRTLVKNLLSDAIVIDTVENLNTPY